MKILGTLVGPYADTTGKPVNGPYDIMFKSTGGGWQLHQNYGTWGASSTQSEAGTTETLEFIGDPPSRAKVDETPPRFHARSNMRK